MHIPTRSHPVPQRRLLLRVLPVLAVAGALSAIHPVPMHAQTPASADTAGAAALLQGLTGEVAIAMKHFVAARKGSSADVQPALDAFNTLASKQPEHPLWLAYAGSATAMLARDAYMPWTKLRKAEQGADMMEKAVALLGPDHSKPFLRGAPESLETRLVVASTLHGLPEFLNRAPAARRVIDGALQAPEFAGAPEALKAEILWIASRIAGKQSRTADETKYIRRLIETDPQSPWVKPARERLAELAQ